MNVDYIVAEIAKASASITTLNSIETFLIYAMLILGVFVVACILLGAYDVWYMEWEALGAWAIITIIVIALIYIAVWVFEIGCLNEYNALVEAYEGLI